MANLPVTVGNLHGYGSIPDQRRIPIRLQQYSEYCIPIETPKLLLHD